MPVIVEFLPSAAQTLRLKESMVHLANFQSITKRLQTAGMNIHESHDMLLMPKSSILLNLTLQL
jgi:hypothetical protein